MDEVHQITRTITSSCDFTADTFADPAVLEYEFMVVLESDNQPKKFSIPTFLGVDYLCVKMIQLVETTGGDMTLQEIYPECVNQDGYCDSVNVLKQKKGMTIIKED